MPGSTLSAAELDKKKIEISAVIDFCNANGLTNWSKTKIFKFFEVPQSTGQRWFPNSSPPNHRRPTQPEVISSVLPTSPESPPAKRQNPVRNGGRDRKRLKGIVEDLVGEIDSESSPPPLSSPSASRAPSSQPEQPLTPPRRKIAQPRKTNGSHPGRQLEYEEVTVIKQEGLYDEIEV
jgi:hypothetical protein